MRIRQLTGTQAPVGRHSRDETGSALILALVMMIVCGTILASVLTYADTRIKTSGRLGEEGNAAATVDGAAKAAVAAIQNSKYTNDDLETCFTAGNVVELKNFNGRDSAVVSCVPVPDTGAQSASVYIGPSNKPGNSILTLGKGPYDGYYVLNSLGNEVLVKGSIFSHGFVKAKKPGFFSPPLDGKLKVAAPNAAAAYVKAGAACEGTITVSPDASKKTCNINASNPNATDAYNEGKDPGKVAPAAYAHPVAVPPPAALPTTYKYDPAGTANDVDVCKFTPGYYDDVTVLNSWTDGNDSCKVYQFEKGDYYFDFHNGDHSTSVMGSGPSGLEHEWLVQGIGRRLVAGKQESSNPRSDCIDPAKDGNDGVRFMFGGNSRLRIVGVDTVICGKYSVNKVPVAIQGIDSGSETTTPGAMVLSTTTTSGFTTPEGAKDSGNGAASWSITNTKSARNYNASFTANGYAATAIAPIVPRSVLDSVKVRVAHSNTVAPVPARSGDSRTVTVTTHDPTDYANSSKTVSCAMTSLSYANVDETLAWPTTTACQNVKNAIAQKIYHPVKYASAAAPKITYYSDLSVNKNETRVESVDVLQLVLTYRAPAWRTQTAAAKGDGCNLNDDFRAAFADSEWWSPSQIGCAALTVTSTVDTDFTIRGTTYLPTSAVNIDAKVLFLPIGFGGSGNFGVGIVSRALYIKASIAQDLALSALPADSYGQRPLAVTLETYVCPKQDTCTLPPPGSPANLTSRVIFTDADPADPKAGKRQVTVQSWSTRQ